MSKENYMTKEKIKNTITICDPTNPYTIRDSECVYNTTCSYNKNPRSLSIKSREKRSNIVYKLLIYVFGGKKEPYIWIGPEERNGIPLDLTSAQFLADKLKLMIEELKNGR